jgi:hypothetical protein
LISLTTFQINNFEDSSNSAKVKKIIYVRNLHNYFLGPFKFCQNEPKHFYIEEKEGRRRRRFVFK